MSDDANGYLHIHENAGLLGAFAQEGNSIPFAPSEADEIAQGTIGTVYQLPDPDNPDDPDAPLYAVKVFTAGDPELRDEFEGEFAVLTDIRARIIDPVAVPPMARATVGEDGQPALILPYYEDGYRLSRHLRQLIAKREWAATEATVVETMALFAESMIALRDTGRTCVDRKAKDFYWRDGRLTVLDWNLVGEINAAACATELQLLNSVWFEMLTGRYATLTIDAMDDATWQHRRVETIEGGVISVGLRLLMEAAQQLPPAQRFANPQGLPDYAVLLPLLRRWQELVESGLEQLSRGAVADFVAALPEPMQNTELAMLIYTDLAWRLGNDGLAASRASMMGLSTEGSEAVVSPDQALIDAVRGFDITQAQHMAREQMFTAADENRPIEAANKARWLLLLDTMAAVRRAGTARDVVRQALLDSAMMLTEAPDKDTPDSLNTAERLLVKADEEIRRLRDDAKYGDALTKLARVKEEVLLRRDALYFRRQERVETQIDMIESLLQHAESVGYLASAEERPDETLLHQIVPHYDVLGAFYELLNRGELMLNDDTLQNLLTLSPDLARLDDDLGFEWRIRDYRDFARYRLRFMPPTPQPDALLDALMTGQGVIDSVPASLRVAAQNIYEANCLAAGSLLAERSARHTRDAYESCRGLSNYLTLQESFVSSVIGASRWRTRIAPYVQQIELALNFYRRWDAMLADNTLRQAIQQRHDNGVLLGDVLDLLNEVRPYQNEDGEWQILIDTRELMDGADSGQTAADWHNFITGLIEQTQAERDNLRDMSDDMTQRREALGDVETLVAGLTQSVVEADAKIDELTDQRKTLGGLILQMTERLNGTDGAPGLFTQFREVESEFAAVQERLAAYPDPEEPRVDEETLAMVEDRVAAIRAELQTLRSAISKQASNALSLRLERLEAEEAFGDPADYAEEIGELHERLLQVAPDTYDAALHERMEALVKGWRSQLRTALLSYPGLRRDDVEAFVGDFDARSKALLHDGQILLNG